MALVVFTGGARSGKSRAAENLAAERHADGRSVTAVAFGRESDDPEFARRIGRHRADRPEYFETAEVTASTDLAGLLDSDSTLVLDCMGTLLGLVMEERWESGSLGDADQVELPAGFEAQVGLAFDECVRAILSRASETIVVTNEVGDGLVPTYATGRLFRDVLGRGNRSLVDGANASYLVVCGRLFELDSLAVRPRWPED